MNIIYYVLVTSCYVLLVCIVSRISIINCDSIISSLINMCSSVIGISVIGMCSGSISIITSILIMSMISTGVLVVLVVLIVVVLLLVLV